MRRPFLVSNRLPVRVVTDKDKTEVVPSAGGVASALHDVQVARGARWLGGSGSITVYATGRPTTCRRVTLRLTLPAGAPVTRLTVSDGRRPRQVTVRAGHVTSVAIDAGRTARRARFDAASPRVVADPTLRALSVRARVTTVTRACTSA